MREIGNVVLFDGHLWLIDTTARWSRRAYKRHFGDCAIEMVPSYTRRGEYWGPIKML